MSESPLARLRRTASLNVYEHTAADEIIAAYCNSVGLPVNRDPDLGIPTPELRSDAADEKAARTSDIGRIYQKWLNDMRATPALIAVQYVLLAEKPLRSIERQMCWRNGSARRHLLVGLRHFAALRGNTPRGARDWKFVRPARIC